MLQKLHSIFFALLISSASIIASDFENKEKPASDNQESAQKKSTCASLCRSLCTYRRAASANNNTPTAESVAMLPTISAPTIDNKQTVVPAGHYAFWKFFKCRANRHLEFKNNDQLVVVCCCPQAIIMNIDTGALEHVSKEEENLYTYWKRVTQTKSQEINDMSSSDELRAIKIHHKGSKKLIRFEKIEMKHCRHDVVALSPNEQVLALGNRKRLLLYRASAPLLENRLEVQPLVGSLPTHTRFCKSEEAKRN